MRLSAFSREPEIVMALKPSTAQITDFETSFDAVPVTSAEGEVIWADVRIDYILSGLTPTVTIRVPVPWNARDTPEERKSKALRCARQLIDHACHAAGMGPAETGIDDNGVEEVLDAVTPTALEGIAQELNGWTNSRVIWSGQRKVRHWANSSPTNSTAPAIWAAAACSDGSGRRR